MKYFSPLLLMFLAGAFMQNAAAEQADRNKPINIEANLAAAEQNNRVRTLEGNVVLTQGTLRLNAEKVVANEDQAGYRVFHLYGATNSQIAFRQKREGFDDYMEGFSDRAEYDERSSTLKLFSRARLKNGDDELKGEYIYYNSATEAMQARNAIPDAKPAAGTPGRVTITIQPKNADAPVEKGAAKNR